jgi:hypothetical protein
MSSQDWTFVKWRLKLLAASPVEHPWPTQSNTTLCSIARAAPGGELAVLIVGDSLSRLHAMSVAALVGATKWNWPLPDGVNISEGYRNLATGHTVRGSDRMVACNGRLRLAFVRNDFLDTRTERLEMLVHNSIGTPWADPRFLKTFDAIVVNTGAHRQPASLYRSRLFVTFVRLQQAAKPTALLAFRATVPGHSRCTHLSAPFGNFTAALAHVRAEPWHNGGEFESRNRIAAELIDELNQHRKQPQLQLHQQRHQAEREHHAQAQANAKTQLERLDQALHELSKPGRPGWLDGWLGVPAHPPSSREAPSVSAPNVAAELAKRRGPLLRAFRELGAAAASAEVRMADETAAAASVAAAETSAGGARFVTLPALRYLDAYSPTLLRGDMHVSRKDCLHYCLPGPADHWTDMFVSMLADHRDGATPNGTATPEASPPAVPPSARPTVGVAVAAASCTAAALLLCLVLVSALKHGSRCMQALSHVPSCS